MRARPPTLEQLFVAAFALVGLRLGLRPIGDNSTFVHLRTGIDLLAGRGLPASDPYSFTAAGEPWVVQSWLVSAAYGVAERAGGLELVVLLHGALYALLAGLLARLARTGVAWRTCAAAATAIGVGVATWSPRPLVVGLVCLALTVVVVDEGRRPWWLVPVAWVWVNSHGSFVLGGIWLGLVALGGRPVAVRRYAPWWVAGALAGGILSPVGPKLLAFPLTVLTKSENFTRVIEWRAPSFRGSLGLVALVSIAGVVVVLARARGAHAPPWPDLLPATAFLALGLASQRNLAAAGVVLAPVLGRALRPGDDGREPSMEPPVDVEDRPSAHVFLAAVIAASAVVFVAAAVATGPLDLDGYPVAASARLPDGARVATTDVAGCYLVLERGRRARVFVDDRFDMYPATVVRDYVTLYDGRPAWRGVLDRHRVDAVLWPRDAPLAAILAADTRWRRIHADDEWAVFVRRE